MASIIIKNNSVGIVLINDLGISIPILYSADVTGLISEQEVKASVDLINYVNDGPPPTVGTLTLNDGTSDIAPGADSIAFLDALYNATDDKAIHDDTSGEISAISEKVTPISGDWLIGEDSASTDDKIKIQVGNLPAAAPANHASSHQHTGGDEVATATPASNAIPKAEASGKIAIGWIPDSVLQQLEYKGTWDASTNTPALSSGTGTKGDYYVVSVAGNTNLDGITDWKSNDWAVFNGTVWEKVDNTQGPPVAHGASHTDGTDDIAAGTTTTKGIVELATDGESGANVVVQGNDARLSDARTPTSHATSHTDGTDDIAAGTTTTKGIVELATDGESGAGVVVQGNDARLSDARTPTSHAASHTDGTDDIAAATTTTKGIVELATDGESGAGVVVQGNDSRLSDSRDPNAHGSDHTDGTDDVADMVGASAGTPGTKGLVPAPAAGEQGDFLQGDGTWATPTGGTPGAHAASHTDGTDDIAAATTTTKGIVELATDGESGAGVVVQGNDSRMSDSRTPTSHAASHTDGTDDIAAATTTTKGIVELATNGETAANVAVQGDDSRLSDARTPTSHASNHTDGTDDVADLVGDTGSGGTHGLAPAPGAGDAAANKYLKADGNWDTPTGVTPAAHAASHTDGTDDIAAATTTTKGIVELATDGESGAGVVVQGNDSRMTDARTPTSHATSHTDGTDDIAAATTTTKGIVELATDGETAANVAVQGNDARLSDARTPTSHATSHTDGTDDIAAATTTTKGIVELATDGETAANVAVQGNDARLSDARTPTSHAASHTDGTDDIAAATTTTKGIVELATDGESGANVAVQGNDARLSDARTPTSHAASHTDGTDDIAAATTTTKGIVELATNGETAANVAVQGNDSRLSDSRTPTSHAASHTDGTDDVATMGAASAGSAGTKGLVPAPAAGEQGEFLRGDGTWAAAGGTITVSEVFASSSASTTNTSYSGPAPTINSMTYTPASGTYTVMVYLTMYTSSDNKYINYALFNNGTKVTNSEVQVRPKSKDDRQTYVTMQTGVTVTGSEAVDVRWYVESNTVYCLERKMVFIKTG